MNILPLRIQLPHENPVGDWLNKLQMQQIEISQYEYSSLAEIKHWAQRSQDLRLFENLIVFENYPSEDFTSSVSRHLRLHHSDGEVKTSYPLTLIAESQQEISLTISYNKQLFNEDTIRCILHYMQVLLKKISANCTQTIRELQKALPQEHLGLFTQASISQISEHKIRQVEHTQLTYIEPRDSIEQQLTVIWEQIFSTSLIGIID